MAPKLLQNGPGCRLCSPDFEEIALKSVVESTAVSPRSFVNDLEGDGKSGCIN